MEGLVKNGIGQFISRNNIDWSNKFPFLLNALESLPISSAIFDGEIVALDLKGKSDFQALQNSIKSKDDHHLRYYIFDILYLNGKDLRDLPLRERKKILLEVVKKSSKYIFISEHLTEGGEDFYKLSCEHELEGIISKLIDSPYQSGRSDLWVKVKCSLRQEFVIGGWTKPQGGRSGLGALLLGVFEDGKLRYVGRVGTGLNTKTLKSIRNDLEKIEISESPFDEKSPKGKDTHWVSPFMICEVSFGSWTSDGILRTPVFKGMREDKPGKDIQMEKVRDISSPEKIIFKKEKITKQDVSYFYKEIADVMLPYLKNRPLSLVRCPNGTDGTCFYQKHISGKVPSSFKTFPILEDKGDGPYLSIHSSQGLQDLVQLNAFEIHSWNSHKDSYLLPDQIVMDLDPGDGVSWREVVEAAFELKELLENLDLKSFVKLTGGKGLHLHIPIAPLYDWNQIKSFARSLALELVSRKPQKYTANIAKKLRKKKIFIDYLRNGYGATAVVPYSLRAAPSSAVALPVDWRELRRIKGPQEFSLFKALKKIKSRKRDPWEGMLKLKQKISILNPIQ